MPKLKPSGYIPAADTLRPGYLQKRMKVYRELIEEQKRRQEQNDAEAKVKVKQIKVKP